MATWIGHLRIAENLLGEIPDLDPRYFALGSLAPDCGRRNEKGKGFIPPKEISHCAVRRGDDLVFEDLRFYRQHLAGLSMDADVARYSFLLAYFIHLTVDGLWYQKIARASKRDFAQLLAERGEQAWWIMKDDWYGHDVKYVAAHRDSLFWRELMPLNEYPEFLPFQESEAIKSQIDNIRGFYSGLPEKHLEDRAYPYLNSATMDRFVADASQLVKAILQDVEAYAAEETVDCSLEFLPPESLAPYNPPLGDEIEA